MKSLQILVLLNVSLGYTGQTLHKNVNTNKSTYEIAILEERKFLYFWKY